MSLTAPNLDDRSFDQLVEEAKRRIAIRSPRWTDFNPSDPGMMLVELMAWMTETVLYRLNRLPEANFIEFLKLIGIRLRPPLPARTWVFFQVSEEVNKIGATIPEGSTLGTRPQPGGEAVSFRTCKALPLTSSRIVKAGSRYWRPDSSGDEPSQMEQTYDLEVEPLPELELFGGAAAQSVPHHLYLGDHNLATHWSPGLTLKIPVRLTQASAEPASLQWEAWDGEEWQMVSLTEDGSVGMSRDGMLVFRELATPRPSSWSRVPDGKSHPQLVPQSGAEAIWLRARLVGAKRWALPVLSDVGWSVEVKTEPTPPERSLVEVGPSEKGPVSPTQVPPQIVETSTDFYPFGVKAARGAAFYVQSSQFQTGGTNVRIEFGVRKPLRPRDGDIEICWEYYTRDNKWKTLGCCTPQGTEANASSHLQDATRAFTAAGGGTVEFLSPGDGAPAPLGPEAAWFIRARIERGQFESDLDARLVVSHILISSSVAVEGRWSMMAAQNYSSFRAASDSTAPFEPFVLRDEQDPAFYLCFNSPPPESNGPYPVFLDIVPPPIPAEESEPLLPQSSREATRSDSAIAPLNPRFAWEYRSFAGTWSSLEILEDETKGFSKSGMIYIVSPGAGAWAKSEEFGTSGFWLRVRREVAEFVRPPRLKAVRLNGVEVVQIAPRQQQLGISTGLPNQVHTVRVAILDSPQVRTRAPGEGGAEASTPALVEWTEVKNFHHSGPEDRHFIADLRGGSFHFGDGRHGLIPPRGHSLSVAFRVTEGARGNVGADTITVIERPLPHVKTVRNFHPAEGGADRESTESAKQRGPWEIRHGNRAVTQEDFVRLARKASPLVGKAACFSEDGVIHVIVVPKSTENKPQPSHRLLGEVSAYLDARRLINTRVVVRGPHYELIDMQIEAGVEPVYSARLGEVRSGIHLFLKTFVHPIEGFEDGSGWPLGRTLHVSELYYLLEHTPGVDHVHKIRISRSQTGVWEDAIRLGRASYPCFSHNITITRVRS